MQSATTSAARPQRPPITREQVELVVRMRDVEHRTWAEIASRLGRREETLRFHYEEHHADHPELERYTPTPPRRRAPEVTDDMISAGVLEIRALGLTIDDPAASLRALFQAMSVGRRG